MKPLVNTSMNKLDQIRSTNRPCRNSLSKEISFSHNYNKSKSCSYISNRPV